jgi:hypothetical protein
MAGRQGPRSTLVQVRTSGMSATNGRRAFPGVARRPGVRADLRLLQTWEGARRSRFERLQVDLSRDPTVRNPLRPSFYRFLCASLFLGGRINNDRTITTNNRLLLLAHVRLGLPRRRSLCANGSAARRPYQPHSNAHAGRLRRERRNFAPPEVLAEAGLQDRRIETMASTAHVCLTAQMAAGRASCAAGRLHIVAHCHDGAADGMSLPGAPPMVALEPALNPGKNVGRLPTGTNQYMTAMARNRTPRSPTISGRGRFAMSVSQSKVSKKLRRVGRQIDVAPRA